MRSKLRPSAVILAILASLSCLVSACVDSGEVSYPAIDPEALEACCKYSDAPMDHHCTEYFMATGECPISSTTESED